MYAVDNIQIRIHEPGLNTPAAPTVPNDGCNAAGISAKNLPAGKE